jgi:hypothetical protein
LYPVAPLLADQVRATEALPGVAERPVGVAGMAPDAAGVARTSAELALSPAELRAETT